MTILSVHYHKDTGEITQWGTSYFDESHFPDHLVVIFNDTNHDDIHPSTHKVELEYKTLVEKTPQEQADWHMPRIEHIEVAIESELTRTDQYMAADRPMSEEDRESWKNYRQQLRDLSKSPDAASRIVNWPKRPDGNDAILDLREQYILTRRLRGEI